MNRRESNIRLYTPEELAANRLALTEKLPDVVITPLAEDTDAPAPPDADLIVVKKNTSFTCSIYDPGGVANVGVRIETPINRAIASAFVSATLTVDESDQAVWVATIDAPVNSGPYNLVWRTTDPEPPAFEGFVPLSVVDLDQDDLDPSNFPAIDLPSVTPSVDDIATLEQSRVVDASNVQQPTFTSSTTVTATQVSALISDGVEQVLAQIPDQIDPAMYPRVKLAAKYATAILLETSFFRVQGISPQGRGASGQSSNVFTYRTLYTDLIAELNTEGASSNQGMRLV